jgi:hypothetical protein
MKRGFLVLTFVAAALLLPGALSANGDPCSLEGTWYGSNTYGGDYVMTIARTGAGSYSAVLVAGGDGAHGEFLRQPGHGGRAYDTTWLGYGDGPDYGYPEGFKLMFYMHGEASQSGCDLWRATTDWDIYLFNAGVQEDPFAEAEYLFTLPGIELTYRRLPLGFQPPS